MIVSGPIWTSTSMNVLSGSMIVTPSVISESHFRRRITRSTSASSWRVLIPRISSFIRHLECPDLLLLAHKNTDHIGEVVLTLRIVVSDPGQGFKQCRRVEDVNARIDLRNLPDFGTGVAVLDDRVHFTIVAPDDPAITARIRRVSRQNGSREPAITMEFKEC